MTINPSEVTKLKDQIKISEKKPKSLRLEKFYQLEI